MSDPNTLGSLVRRRRLESGYSLGQLASKVGKTAAEVRAWERDNEQPEHGILERLAETLELDLDEIKARLEADKKTAAKAASKEEAAEPPGDSADTPEDAVEGAASDDESEKDVAESAVAEEDAAEEEDDVVAAVAPAPDEEDESSPADDEPGFAVDDPFKPPPPEDDEFDLLNAPTEAVPVPVITETATAARAERAAAVIQEPPPPLPVVEPAPDADPGLLRYLEPLRLLFDPNSRYLYWIRAGLTVAVLLVFAIVLFDQLGKLLDAVGELLDTIEPSSTPDELDALGPLSS
jgi:transcriptional regulator with XRE-family HTH domain